jgi:hypothetical protein
LLKTNRRTCDHSVSQYSQAFQGSRDEPERHNERHREREREKCAHQFVLMILALDRIGVKQSHVNELLQLGDSLRRTKIT